MNSDHEIEADENVDRSKQTARKTELSGLLGADTLILDIESQIFQYRITLNFHSIVVIGRRNKRHHRSKMTDTSKSF